MDPNLDMDSGLVARLVEGDMLALEATYRRHSPALVNHAFRILLDRQLAEDCLHDIFIRLPQAIQGFRGQSSLSTWLYRITHMRCLEMIRNNGNRQRLLSLHAPDWALDQEECSAEKLHSDRDLLQKVLAEEESAIRSLLWLKEAEDLSLAELSVILGEPEGTLKSKLSRARARMRDHLERMEIHSHE